jgi:hypothetical protein
MSFLVSLPQPPGQATLVSPSGVISTTAPTYTWNAVSGATRYYLWVNGPANTPVVQQVFYAGTACTGATCSATPAATLANGRHTWWAQAQNDAGNGPWSQGMSFVVSGGEPPGPATLVSPNGSITAVTPTYTWSSVSGATQYYLWVNGPAGTPVVQELVSAAAACSGATCSTTPATALALGHHTWWVQAQNAHGNGPWSSGLTFRVDLAKPTLISPSGSVVSSTPTYSWNEVPGAIQYYLWVNGPSGAAVVHQFFLAAGACSAGTCSATPQTPLAPGAHIWWVQARADETTSAWSDPLAFTR